MCTSTAPSTRRAIGSGQPPPGARARLAVRAGRLAGRTSRLLRLGQGAVTAGQVCLTIDPGAADRLAAGHLVVVVSGTNGKTTTTRMIAAALRRSGPVATNRTGANLRHGIASALIDGPVGGPAVLEVDEALVPWAVEHLRPEVVVLLNVSRDQLDRHHEPRSLADLWRRCLVPGSVPVVVANADDPLVVHAAGGTDAIWVAAGTTWTADSATCPRCGDRIERDDASWACSACDLARPVPTVSRRGGVVRLDDRVVELQLHLPGEGALEDATMALGALHALGQDLGRSTAALAGLRDVEGRYSTTRVGTHEVRLLLAKNPAGWSDAMSVATDRTAPVIIGLNAREQDGRDPSWIWDVRFEQLSGRRVICVGERALDLLVRLQYAGVESSSADGLAEALERCEAGPVDVVANYTAFQAFRTAIHG